MRIAVVHSYYSSATPSGENVVVDAQVNALRDAGHDVIVISQHTDARAQRRSYPLEAAATVATGIGPSPEAQLRRFQPDVIHVHNLFPNFGTRWLARWPGPVVATMHNFRPMCAAGTLFRDGEVCTRCPDGEPWAAVRHGCYRDSRLATVPLGWRNRNGVIADDVVQRADRVIVLSDRAREMYERAGEDSSRLCTVPNFVEPAPQRPPDTDINNRWLYVGRITAEKGLLELLRAWPPGEFLDVVGDGPLRESAVKNAPSGVRFLGSLPHRKVRNMMAYYQGLVFPSRWFETLGMVYLESLSVGLPVVTLQGSVPADDVAKHHLGAVLPRDPTKPRLQHTLSEVRSDRQVLRERCQKSFKERFTPGRWCEAVQDTYQEAIREHGTVPKSRTKYIRGRRRSRRQW